MPGEVGVRSSELPDIEVMRELYRDEMDCQIIHDSIHVRTGWSREFVLDVGGVPVGYGSVAVGGPWRDKHALYEFFVRREWRERAFEMFEALLEVCGAVMIETQSNDPMLTVMLHTYARNVQAESILFEDAVVTALRTEGAHVRSAVKEDLSNLRERELDEQAGWVLTLNDEIAGAGGVLYHYNRPYGDVYMKIAEPFRRKGLGAFLVQELKAACRAGGSVPSARCNVENKASRRTLQKAGFVPCGNILVGELGCG